MAAFEVRNCEISTVKCFTIFYLHIETVSTTNVFEEVYKLSEKLNRQIWLVPDLLLLQRRDTELQAYQWGGSRFGTTVGVQCACNSLLELCWSRIRNVKPVTGFWFRPNFVWKWLELRTIKHFYSSFSQEVTWCCSHGRWSCVLSWFIVREKW